MNWFEQPHILFRMWYYWWRSATRSPWIKQFFKISFTSVRTDNKFSYTFGRAHARSKTEFQCAVSLQRSKKSLSFLKPNHLVSRTRAFSAPTEVNRHGRWISSFNILPFSNIHYPIRWRCIILYQNESRIHGSYKK